MALKIVEKVWGSEEWIANREYCGKLLRLKKGMQCSLHFHQQKHETFYLLDGHVSMYVDDKTLDMRPSDSVEIPPYTLHRFAGIEDSLIIEVSTHHDDTDVVRLVESGPFIKEGEAKDDQN